MHRRLAVALAVISPLPLVPSALSAKDLIPPTASIKTGRPRVLLRPARSRHAVSLAQLKAVPRDAEFNRMLGQLRGQDHAAAQAMVWLLTGEKDAAEKAIARMQRYKEWMPFNVRASYRYLRGR